ncbi:MULTISPECIES: LysE family translocator [Bacillaceae]|uniref:Amino acid transporter n=1 Tax=Alkalicoccobacillus plakortidis TaxID=444060 RepID=A0A9D5DPJ8_9BACI|nr:MULTISPECIES: LysE family transporter [Bacillaceae]KQL57942.1 hypothetical protein AN965_06370 [Alkalicoccobacillus plakortidis]
MPAFLSAFILGLSLAVPVGPICLAILKKGVSHGFLPALFIGIGAILADLLFMILIYFGMAQFIFIPSVQVILYVFGSGLLMYLGIESINKRKTALQRSSSLSSSILASFWTGLSIALFNPINLMFWFGIFGSTLVEFMTEQSGSVMVYIVFLFTGILVWNISLSFLASFFGQFLSQSLLPILNVIAGLCLLLFGFHFALKLAEVLF